MVCANNNLIPRQTLFGNPDKTSVRLSHDGKYISYIAPKDGVLNVWIGQVDKPLEARVITKDKDRGVRSYIWCYDNEHILFVQDEKGDENFRIYSYSLKTNVINLLTPAKGVRASINSLSHKKPHEVIISMNERDKRYFDLYKLNLQSGKKELLLQNEKYTGFVFDSELNLRFSMATNADAGEEYFEYKNSDFVPFMTVGAEDVTNTGIIGFDDSDSILYLLDSRNRNTAALKELNLNSGKFTTIAEDNKADIGVFTVHPMKDTIQAVSSNYDRVSYKVLDNDIKQDIEYLCSLNPGDLNIAARSMDDQTWLVAYLSDIRPVEYFKYDRSARKVEYLFNNKAELLEYQLSPMHPVIIKSRDGLDLVSYLTLPAAASEADSITPKAPVPLVLLVHGGPWARDDWGLNMQHQWLASRGYAVLSVNFRGSTGFGKHFANAANMQWGKKMHDDLIDAVNWAIEKKIALADKIAIMGGSYGGYATLVGMTMTPDVFACGIDLVGPSSLMTLIKSVPPYWQPILNDFKKRIGPWDTKEEIEALNQISPLYFVDNIKKPLFIGQGAHDPRVKQAEADQIVDAMRKKKIPVVYALYEDEGHGFAKPTNRLSYYALVETFLADVLGGKKEPIGDDLKGANFLLNGHKTHSSIEAGKIISESMR